MRLEDYTADAICQAMSLPGFIEQPWAQREYPIMRILLTPSFHPELCITLSRNSEAVLLSVVALTTQYWSHSSEMCLPHEHEEFTLPQTAFDEALTLFTTAHGTVDPQRCYICLDGMGSESCLVSRAGTSRVRAEVSMLPQYKQFVAWVIDLAWNACRLPQIRNSLAQSASYLGVNYPVQEVPPQPPLMRLAVLGTPQERSDFLEMLRQSKKAKTT
jgi:hypothetical protein